MKKIIPSLATILLSSCAIFNTVSLIDQNISYKPIFKGYDADISNFGKGYIIRAGTFTKKGYSQEMSRLAAFDYDRDGVIDEVLKNGPKDENFDKLTINKLQKLYTQLVREYSLRLKK